MPRLSAFAHLSAALLAAPSASPVASAPPAPSVAMPPAPPRTPYEAFARRVYDAIAANRWADANATLRHPPPGVATGSDSLHASRDRVLYSERAVVTLDAGGVVAWHRVVDGILLYADPELTVVSQSKKVILELGPLQSGNAPATRVVTSPTGAPRRPATASAGWAVAADGTDGFVAIRRRDGRIVRNAHGAPALADDANSVAAAGRFLVSSRAPGQFEILRDDADAARPVVGCTGTMLDAAALNDDELVIHAAKEGASEKSHLCYVNAAGVTLRIVPLGSATCGLAKPRACKWVLEAQVPDMLAFGSMRGDTMIADPATGTRLRIVMPVSMQKWQMRPLGFSTCGAGELCAETKDWRTGNDIALSIVRQGDTAQARPRPSSWCVREGLPVPPRLCTP